jgi:hypothetical protein
MPRTARSGSCFSSRHQPRWLVPGRLWRAARQRFFRHLAAEPLEDRRLLDAADYLIVTTSLFTAASTVLTDFVAHKTGAGYGVRVATEADWGGGTGDAAAENLRTWLAGHVAAWGTDYVLLIGDPSPATGDVPMKQITPQPGGAGQVPTDYYYAALVADWDADSDGRLGEWDDDFGSAPAHDVLVGRIPVYNANYAAVDSILQKTIDYENELDRSWRQNILLAMAQYAIENVDGQAYRAGAYNWEVGEAIVNDVAIPNGYGYYRLYEEGGGVDTHQQYGLAEAALTGANFIGEWSSEPYGVVAWASHGWPDHAGRMWWDADWNGNGTPSQGSFDPNGDGNFDQWEILDEPFIEATDAASLDDEHPAIVIASSCGNAEADNAGNLAYALLQNGAVALFAGATGTDYDAGTWTPAHGRSYGDIAAFSYFLTMGLVTGELDGVSTRTTGAALAWVREHLDFNTDFPNTAYNHTEGANRRNPYSMNLFGDPSLTLGPSAEPDLVGRDFRLPLDNLQASGGSVSVDFGISNRGLTDAGAFDVEFFLSDDAVIDPATDRRLHLSASDPAFDPAEPEAFHMAGIAAGDTASGRVRLEVPVTDPFRTDGDYVIGMLIDADRDVAAEVFRGNNQGRGQGRDYDDVYYHATASFPFFEGWESGAVADYWDVIPGGDTGRVQVTGEHGPYEGAYHLTLDDTTTASSASLNQLVLHLDLRGQSEVTLGFANREWDDGDDSEDRIEISRDGGDTWSQLFGLQGEDSQERYGFRTVHAYGGADESAADILIRFQQLGASPIPDDGMAFDSIRVVAADRPDPVATEFDALFENLQVSGGVVPVAFTVENRGDADTGPFDVQFYLSADATIDPATDVLLQLDPSDPRYDASAPAAYHVSHLATGLPAGGTVQLRVPAADPFRTGGRYYLGLVVDPEGTLVEALEDNNANRGKFIDTDDVYYHATASFPFYEDWETGAFAAGWEVVPGSTTGRIQITSDNGPYAGSRHVTLDDRVADWNESVNELTLHLDLTGQEYVLLGFANREWSDRDDPEDAVQISRDGGDSWASLLDLTAADSTSTYEARTVAFLASGRQPRDVLLRFRQRGNSPIPWGGMAFDEIFVDQGLPDLIGTSLSVTPRNLQTSGGLVTASFTVRNDTPLPAGYSRVRFYLSPDSRIDPTEDRLLTLAPSDPHYADADDHAAVAILGLWGTEERSDSVTLVVPAGDPFGGGNHYYLGMVVDADRDVVELEEANNRNRGQALDRDWVQYVAPATFPWSEDWEAGTFADCWEAIPGAEGRIQITTDYGPWDGDQHLVMDDRLRRAPDSVNQLVLHANLAGRTGVELSFANREWHDDNDPEDQVEVSVDGGATWHLLASLRRLESGAEITPYTLRRYALDSLRLTYTADTLIRFQLRSNAPVPDGGMAFDSLQLSLDSAGPQVLESLPPARVARGQSTVEFRFSEPMDTASFTLAEDLAQFRGPDGSDLRGALTGYTWAGSQVLRIAFTPQNAYGTYTLILGPGIADASGNELDQNRDGRNGDPGDTYLARFTVAEVLYEAKLDVDPHWSLDSGSGSYQWEYGRPGGGGSQGGDPGSGYDGPNVIGYNLSGDYPDGLRSPEYATTPAINCTGYQYLALSFYRWLGVDGQPGDQANIQVSADGLTWADVWSNPDELLLDQEYVYQLYRLSPVADGQPTVYVRWGQGPTDASRKYGGWNIDNVYVTGIPMGSGVPDIHVTDSAGVATDQMIDFGSVDLAAGGRTHTLTIANVGTEPLAITRWALSDEVQYSLVWDGDGVPPAEIVPGGTRTATVTFAPVTTGEHAATVTIESTDPDPFEQRIVVTLSGTATVTPTYGWTRTVGAIGFDAAEALALDAAGNVFWAGFFEGSVDFNPDPVAADVRTATGSRDIFVTRLGPDGSYGWTWTAGGPQADEARALCVDSDGSVVVTGEYRQTVLFGPGDSHTALGYNDVFVTKLLADGSPAWTRTFGGTSGDAGRGVAVDASHRIYVTGDFQGTVDFDPSDGGVDNRASVSLSQADAFLTVLNSAGAYVRTTTIGGVGYDSGSAVAVGGAGQVLLTGVFSNSIDFRPAITGGEHTSVGDYDVFVAQWDATGAYAWSRTFGSPDADGATALALDAAGNAYVTGYFLGTADFAPAAGHDLKTSAGAEDGFVTRLNADGSYGWTRTLGGTSWDFGQAVFAGPTERVLVAGSFRGRADFDPAGAHDYHTALGQDDCFVTEWRPDGAYVATDAWGSTGYDGAYGVWGSAGGDTYVAGYFQNNADFDPTASVDRRFSNGNGDAFVTKSWQRSAVGGRLEGRIRHDLDRDGAPDLGEPGLEGWMVYLDADGNGARDDAEPHTLTDADGGYAFTDLAPGSYTVAAIRPPGWIQTAPAARLHTVTLGPGQQQSELDFGHYLLLPEPSVRRILSNGLPGVNDDRYEYAVEFSAVGLVHLELTTPWGAPVDSDKFLPPGWHGEAVAYQQGDFRFAAQTANALTRFEFAWTGLSPQRWASLNSGLTQWSAVYAGGEWAGNADFQAVAQPVTPPAIQTPVHQQSDVTLAPTIAWNLEPNPRPEVVYRVTLRDVKKPTEIVASAELPSTVGHWTVPRPLRPSTTYRCALQLVTETFVPADGASVSEQAAAESESVFVTINSDQDEDLDGIPSATETQAPHDGDGNSDGVLDSLQAHVASLPNAVTGTYLTLAGPPGTRLEDVTALPSPAPAPAGIEFGLGFVRYRLTNVSPGAAVTVTLYVHQSLPLNAYYRYGPESKVPADHWYPFVFAGGTGAEILADRIVLHLVDGLRGDDDLTANGIIVDPGAPGVNQRTKPWQNPDAAVDVDDDGAVAPLDVLLLINELNARGARDLPVPPVPPFLPPSYFDVSGDNAVEPLDVLLVINDLNLYGSRVLPGSGGLVAGEGPAAAAPILAEMQGPQSRSATESPVSAGSAAGSMTSAYRASSGDGQTSFPFAVPGRPRVLFAAGLGASLQRLSVPGLGIQLSSLTGRVQRAPQQAGGSGAARVLDDELENLLLDFAEDIDRAWHASAC